MSFSSYHVEPVTEPIYQGKRSKLVFKIVENDPWREYPFMYFIAGNSCNILIDTGCGSGNLRDFLGENFTEQINTKELVVINTINHFDHTGGNSQFSLAKIRKLQPGCKDLCAADANPEYTLNPETNLGWAVGCKVVPWYVTRWLKDNDVISLGSDWDNFIYILHTPGHTPDSLSVYYPREKRMFIGDFLYRWTTILAIQEHCDLKAYEASALKLLHFIRQRPDRDEIRLSCGHVDPDLPWFPILEEFHELLHRINDESISPKAPPPGFVGSIYETRDLSLRLLVGNFDKLPPSKRPKEKKKKPKKSSKEVAVKERPYFQECDTNSMIDYSGLLYRPVTEPRKPDRIRYEHHHPDRVLLGHTMITQKPNKQLHVNPSRRYYT